MPEVPPVPMPEPLLPSPSLSDLIAPFITPISAERWNALPHTYDPSKPKESVSIPAENAAAEAPVQAGPEAEQPSPTTTEDEQEPTMSTSATTQQQPQPGKKESFFARALHAVGNYFKGFFAGILGSSEAEQFENGIISFVKTDAGTLALDAVQYAGTLTTLSTADQRAAAVAKLRTDLAAAGKDITKIAESTLNLFVEAAYTYIKGTVSALPAVLAK